MKFFLTLGALPLFLAACGGSTDAPNENEKTDGGTNTAADSGQNSDAHKDQPQPTGKCTVVGTWKGTNLTAQGDPGSYCESLAKAAASGQTPDEISVVATASGAHTYSFDADGEIQVATEAPDSCRLEIAIPPTTNDQGQYKVTTAVEGPAVFAIDGATGTLSYVSTLTSSPTQDGMPCDLKVAITLQRQ